MERWDASLLNEARPFMRALCPMGPPAHHSINAGFESEMHNRPRWDSTPSTCPWPRWPKPGRASPFVLATGLFSLGGYRGGVPCSVALITSVLLVFCGCEGRLQHQSEMTIASPEGGLCLQVGLNLCAQQLVGCPQRWVYRYGYIVHMENQHFTQ